MLNQQLADTLDLYSQAHLHTQFVVVLIIWHLVDETHNGMDDTENAQPLDWRERRRLRAWELHKQGWSQRSIAAELGVTQGAVYQWLKRVREKGSIDALRHHPAPGRHTALTDSQIKEIPALLARGPQAFGFRSRFLECRTTGTHLPFVTEVLS